MNQKIIQTDKLFVKNPNNTINIPDDLYKSNMFAPCPLYNSDAFRSISSPSARINFTSEHRVDPQVLPSQRTRLNYEPNTQVFPSQRSRSGHEPNTRVSHCALFSKKIENKTLNNINTA